MQHADLNPYRDASWANQPYIVRAAVEQVCRGSVCLCVRVLAMLWDNMLDTYKKLT